MSSRLSGSGGKNTVHILLNNVYIILYRIKPIAHNRRARQNISIGIYIYIYIFCLWRVYIIAKIIYLHTFALKLFFSPPVHAVPRVIRSINIRVDRSQLFADTSRWKTLPSRRRERNENNHFGHGCNDGNCKTLSTRIVYTLCVFNTKPFKIQRLPTSFRRKNYSK